MKPWSFVFALCLSSLTFGQMGPNHGVPDWEMDKRGRDWFLDLSEKRKGAPLPEYEIRGALATYTAAVRRMNAARIAKLPAAQRPSTTKFAENLETFAVNIVLAEQAISGGGTMYLTFNMFAQADAGDIAKAVLTRQAKTKSKHVVSDVTKRLTELEKTIRENDDNYAKRPEALAALAKSNEAYKEITVFLKDRPRSESDFFLAFCVKSAQFSTLP